MTKPLNEQSIKMKIATVVAVLIFLSTAVYQVCLAQFQVQDNTEAIRAIEPKIQKIDTMEGQLDYIQEDIREIKNYLMP